MHFAETGREMEMEMGSRLEGVGDGEVDAIGEGFV